MTAYEDVLSWAKSMPWWQQKALARIIAGETIGEHDYEEIARSLFEEPESPPEGGWFAQSLPPQATKDEPVCIVAVRELANVNSLAPGQELTFEPSGLTVVFGTNGSGKSGYARVISSMVGARHQKKILSNVFVSASGPQSGEIVFKVGDSERTALLGQSPDPDLSRIAFYDGHCGDTYLTTEAKVSYRPSAVKLLEDLATVCTGVRHVIESWKQETSQPGSLPEVDPRGSAKTFLRGLSASTTDDAVTAAVACPSDVAEQLEKQMNEVARLRVSDPVKEKKRLVVTAEDLTTIADHLEALDKAVGMLAEKQLAELVENEKSAQEAASLASRRTFANEPLSGVGSGTWRALWRAAESYSKVAYPDHNFPHTADSAVCVLCQQQLGADAADRLERFQQFVMDTTAEEARVAQRRVADFRERLNSLDITPITISSAITRLELNEELTPRSLNSILEALRTRTSALVGGEEANRVDVTTTVAALRENAATHRERADNVDAGGFAEQLTQAEAKERHLRDQIAMRDGRQLIEAERTRLQREAGLAARLSETNTRSITVKVGELTRTYVTEEAGEYFTREAKNLGLEHVTFGATKGQQGSLLHKEAYSWGVGEDESGDGLYCGFEGVVRAAVIGV